MDMRKFGSGFLKPEDVRDAPFQGRVLNIYTSEKYKRPVLVFDTGEEFSLNETNRKALVRAWGFESDIWIGLEVELSLGFYKDWETDPPEEKETVAVRPISARPLSASDGTKATTRPSVRDAMNDEIPF
jgi:hypothetical protein